MISPNLEKQATRSEESTRPGKVYKPHVDIFESGEGIVVRADMPGVSEEGVDVRLDEDVLSIAGRISIDDYSNLEPIHTEYGVGHFERKFTLSSDLDIAKIVGRIADGVLEIRLPRREESRPRQIPIHSV